MPRINRHTVLFSLNSFAISAVASLTLHAAGFGRYAIEFAFLAVVQAFVFTMLSAIYISLSVSHDH